MLCSRNQTANARKQKHIPQAYYSTVINFSCLVCCAWTTLSVKWIKRSFTHTVGVYISKGVRRLIYICLTFEAAAARAEKNVITHNILFNNVQLCQCSFSALSFIVLSRRGGAQHDIIQADGHTGWSWQLLLTCGCVWDNKGECLNVIPITGSSPFPQMTP